MNEWFIHCLEIPRRPKLTPTSRFETVSTGYGISGKALENIKSRDASLNADATSASLAELGRLAATVSRHIVAPLVRQLTDMNALGKVATVYLQKHPHVDESMVHWFHEITFQERRDLHDMQKRVLG